MRNDGTSVEGTSSLSILQGGRIISNNICLGCSTQNPAGSLFCKECGHAFKEDDSQKKNYLICPQCNTENRETSRLCFNCGALLKIEPPVEQLSHFSDNKMDFPLYSGFFKRSMAFLIDLIVPGFFSILLILFSTLLLLGPSSLLSGNFESIKTEALSHGLLAVYFIPLIFFVTGLLYHTLLESSRAMATPGKLVVEIFVTGKDNTKITFGKASIRFFLKFTPPVILFIFLLLDFSTPFKVILLLFCLSLFFPSGPKKQTIIDLIAGTQVQRKKEPVSEGEKLSLSLIGRIEEINPALSRATHKAEIKITDEPLLQREAPPDEILIKLKKREGKDFITYAKLGKREWLCVCGTLLNVGISKCYLCKRDKYYVLSYYTKESVLRNFPLITEATKKGELPVEVKPEEKEPTLVKETPPEEILLLLREIEGDDFATYAKQEGDKWLCVCANVNSMFFEECFNCRREKSAVLAKYTKEKLEDQN